MTDGPEEEEALDRDAKEYRRDLRRKLAHKLAEQADDPFSAAPAYWLKCADEVLAIAAGTQRAETPQSGSVPKGCQSGPKASPSTSHRSTGE